MVAVAGIGGGRPAGHDQLPIMKSGGQQPLADRVHNRRACASGPKYTIMSFSGPFSRFAVSLSPQAPTMYFGFIESTRSAQLLRSP